MKVKIFWADGTDSFMYGEDYKDKDIDVLVEQLKRKPSKRLYRFGTRLDLIREIEVYDQGNLYIKVRGSA